MKRYQFFTFRRMLLFAVSNRNSPPVIRNIIFDYGGVIIDIDYQRTQQAFEALGVKRFSEIFSQLRQSALFDRFDSGEITDREFREAIKAHAGIALQDEQIDAAWNSMLLGIDKEKFQLLRQVHLKYRTFLLSNTNNIHLRAISQYLAHTYPHEHIDLLFDAVYYSCRMGMRKPDPSIYRKVLDDHELEASETLFIDDSQANVEGAGAAGLHGLHYDPRQPLEACLNAWLVREAAGD